MALIRMHLMLSALITVGAQFQNIDNFGAIAGIDSHSAALQNGEAFMAAVHAANASSTSRTVLVPAGSVYSFLPAVSGFTGLQSVTILLEGTLNVSTANFSTSYPGWPNPWAPLSFSACTGLRIVSTTGAGLVNGRGNLWWWYTILVADHRNNLLNVDTSPGFELTGVSFVNSPQWHMWLSQNDNARITNVTVQVDIDDQLSVYRYIGGVADETDPVRVLRAAGRIGSPGSMHQDSAWVEPSMRARAAAIPAFLRSESWWSAAWDLTPPVPMIWALNTDGIDFSGRNVTVSHCKVTNFDDAVCVKPQQACTSGSISDIHVTWGVGISMGSVPPDDGGNCIANVDVTNVTFVSPLKAVYIKPNPAKDASATGLIANVTYTDLTIHAPVWWAIWIGPQQQDQPGSGADTGCSFFFPLPNTTCPADPEVTMNNIVLDRVTVYDSVLSPGVLLANSTNPGTEFVFKDVLFINASTWPVQDGYFCEGVQGVALGSTYPLPPCFKNGTEKA